MQIAVVEGQAVSSHKHRSLRGRKLLVVQPLTRAGEPDGEPLLVVDTLGAGHGCRVLISSDGKGARELVRDDSTPVRWTVIGICDD